MFKPVKAICDNTECDNNRNGLVTLVCTSCGHCADDALHSDCEANHILRDPQVAVCANTECDNNRNQREVVVCSACGTCADCSLHGH
jgi:hypothetical protein